MRTRLLFTVAALLLTAAVTPRPAHADSIALTNHTGNSYTYDLLLSNNPSTFAGGDTLSVSGRSGVTGVTSPYAGYVSTGFTDNSASITNNYIVSYTPNSSGYYDMQLFTLTSTSADLSGAQYSFMENVNGSDVLVQGTVADLTASPVAEPARLMLLGTGFSGLLLVLRTKHREAHGPIGS